MARAPLLTLSQISLTFGGNPIFDGLDLAVQAGDRIALVGRNGTGKSTLMKIMAGLSEADKVQLQSYITGCYGSLTTFNVLFADREQGFVGTGKDGDG